MKGVTIENIETGEIIEFTNKSRFVDHVKKIYETDNSTEKFLLNKIRNYSDAVYYIRKQNKLYMLFNV